MRLLTDLARGDMSLPAWVGRCAGFVGSLELSTCLLRGLAIGALIVVLMLAGCTPAFGQELRTSWPTNYCHVVDYQPDEQLPAWSTREDLRGASGGSGAVDSSAASGPRPNRQTPPQSLVTLEAGPTASSDTFPQGKRSGSMSSGGPASAAIPTLYSGVAVPPPGPLRHFEPAVDVAAAWKLFALNLGALLIATLLGWWRYEQAVLTKG